MNLNKLKDIKKGLDCVVFTCGPSFKEYNKEKLNEFCKGKVIICVKEAILEYGYVCDYFFSNFLRHRDYNLDKTKSSCIKIHQRSLKYSPKDLSNYDIVIDEDRPFNSKNQLLKKKNFEDYDFKNKQKRPWGPGILYESVFYFCKHIGCKNIFTIGWDLIDNKKSKKLTHYFDEKKNDLYSKSKIWKNGQYIKEMEFVNTNIVHMYDYLKKNGVNIIVVGKQSFVNSHIPRIYL